jgi:type II secretory pathway component PulC
MKASALGLVGLGLSFCVGCGGNVPPAAPAKTDSPAAVAAKPARVDLSREEVTAAVEAGLGRFLQHIEVEPSLQGGRFVGFRIVGLHPPEFWDGVDLMPGDVVTRVNGRSIERDTDAFTTFEALRSAPELRVTFMRGGEERELVYKIVGAPAPSKNSDAG